MNNRIFENNIVKNVLCLNRTLYIYDNQYKTMLTKAKQTKLLDAIKKYSKKYLQGRVTELDESGTRLMINHFLIDVLGYTPIEEIKTEYMIKGTYADYVLQLKGTRHFLVEVKALSFNLSDKHLRQAINYGANEGIEWALLTNGKCFDFYKIIFDKPIDSRKIFSIDLSDPIQVKNCVSVIQLLHRDAVANKGLEMLWNKAVALDPNNVAAYLYMPNVTNYIKRSLKIRYNHKFSDEEIKKSIDKVLTESIKLENIKSIKIKKERVKAKSSKSIEIIETDIIAPVVIEENTKEINIGD